MCVHIRVVSLDPNFTDDYFKKRLDSLFTTRTVEYYNIISTLVKAAEVKGYTNVWDNFPNIMCETCGSVKPNNGYQILFNCPDSVRFHSNIGLKDANFDMWGFIEKMDQDKAKADFFAVQQQQQQQQQLRPKLTQSVIQLVDKTNGKPLSVRGVRTFPSRAAPVPATPPIATAGGLLRVVIPARPPPPPYQPRALPPPPPPASTIVLPVAAAAPVPRLTAPTVPTSTPETQEEKQKKTPTIIKILASKKK